MSSVLPVILKNSRPSLSIRPIRGTIDGVIDVAAAVADSGEPNKWKVDTTANYATSDGTHPSPTFHSTIMPPIVNAWAAARGIAADGSGT